jgi:hypothetical protein
LAETKMKHHLVWLRDVFVLRRTSEQLGATCRVHCHHKTPHQPGCLHGVRVERDAVGDQGGGGSVKVEKTNQELLCK